MELWKKVSLVSLHAFAIVISLLLYCYANPATNPHRPGTITVVSDDTYPPYIFRDSGGKLQGIIVDQWNLWEEKTGIKVNLLGMDWGKAQKFMADGNADVIDTIFYTEERAKEYDFTKPYVTIEVPVFFHQNISGINDADSLHGFTVGVKEGDACIEILRRHGITTLQVYNSYEEIIKAAADQKIKVFCIDQPPALYYLYKMNIENEYRRSLPLYSGQFHRAVKKGRQDLLNIIEEGFSKISGNEYAGIDKRWMGSALGINPVYIRQILYSSMGAALLVVILILWNYTLRRRVSAKTSQLQHTLEALKESEEKYRELVENANSIILRRDNFGNVTFFNEFAQRFFGYGEEEIAGQNVVGTIVPELESTGRDLKGMIEDIGLNPDLYVNNINENMRRTGERVWVAWTNKPIRFENGRAVEILCVGNDITVQKRAEEALRESELKFRTLVEHIPQRIFYKDRESVYISCNDLYALDLGIPAVEIAGRTDFEFYPRELAEKYRADDRRVMETGQDIEVEEDYIEDGNLRTVLTRKTPVRADHGEVLGVLGVFTDITERIRTQAALQESEGKYRQLIEQAADGIFITDSYGRFTLANSKTCEMLGYTKEELLQLSIIDTYPAEEADIGRQRLASIEAGGGMRFEGPMKRKDGTLFWAEASTSKLEDGRLQAIIHDITERKAADAERARLISAIEQVAEGIMIADSNWTILFANPAFERITGYGGGELIGRHASVLKGDPRDKALYTNIRNTLARGEIWSGRFSVRKKDGALHQIEALSSPVKDASGNIISYINIRRDVTLEDKLERELHQAQKMESIGTLAGGIAHDFNNILTSIIGFTELAQTSVAEGSPLRSHLNHVLNSGFRARDLVKQILTFSRQTEQERKPIPFAPVVKEALKLLRSSLPSTIEIRQDIALSPNGGIVLADPTQIHQVLMNLCTNAAHAMRSKGGVLSVRVSEVDVAHISRHPDLRPGQYLKLTVTDTGHGMDKAVLERIFDPYFTTKGLGEGTGLGLSVVQGIVRNYGGAISAYSEPGRGTTFHVFLPTIEEDVAPEVKAQDTPPMGNERILFVDDEKSLVDYGKEILERLGYKVTAKTSSLEALEILRAEPDAFDLVITDMTMPDLTGAALAEKILAIRKDISVILCSGFSELISGKQARELAIREFVTKPYTINTLATAVRKALQR